MEDRIDDKDMLQKILSKVIEITYARLDVPLDMEGAADAITPQDLKTAQDLLKQYAIQPIGKDAETLSAIDKKLEARRKNLRLFKRTGTDDTPNDIQDIV